MAKPCYALLLAWLGSLFIGGISPVNGYLIIQCMWGLGESAYLGTDGLGTIWPFIITMFAFAFVAFIAKASQQSGFSKI